MGYYTEYFSTLMKGPWALAVKERWDSRRVIRYSRQADKLIYDVLPEKVEVEHKVTQALRDEDKATDAINEVIKYGLQLAVNSSFEDEVILRAIKHLIENMQKFHEIIIRMKGGNIMGVNVVALESQLETLSKKFAIMIKNQTQKAEGQEREEMKDVMNLIKQSQEFDKETFVTAVKQRFSSINKQTLLARFALRYDIQHEKKLVLALERLSVRLEEQKKLFERILTNLKVRYNQLPGVVSKFKQIVEEAEKDIQGAFFYSYKIKKRDFNLMLTMLVNAEVLRKLNLKWVRMHFMPAVPTEARIKDIENLEKKMGEKLHVIAQALRIELNAQEDLARKALPLAA